MTTDTDAQSKRLDRFLAGIERRALIMTELATHDREEALDLVQDAMLAFVNRYAGKTEQDWPPLFYRVLQNKIRDWHRRGRVRRRWRVWLRDNSDTENSGDPIQALADPSAIRPEDAIDDAGSMAAISQAVQELPERQRQAVLLRIWEELDVAATAKAMECTASSVKTHLSRGLARLRQRLEALR